MMFKQSMFAAAGFFLTVNAHLFISSPTPIQGSAPKDPLQSAGANFPCHGVALPGSGGQKMAVGSQQKLAFELAMPSVTSSAVDGIYSGGANTAVHGGGSCQLSITYETDPEKIKQASAWHVIYSIEEGCPTNSVANLDGLDAITLAQGNYSGPLGGYLGAIPCNDKYSNGFDCVNSFDFTIPKGVKNGQATLAWTWFNTVGNREMYMNCVAIEITGGESDNSAMADFPDMFVANIFDKQWKTDEMAYVKFPNPGKYVTTKTATTTYMSGGAVQTITPEKTYPLAIPSSWLSSGAGAGSVSVSASVAQSYSTPASYAASPSAEATPSVAETSVASAVNTAPMAAATGYSTGYSTGNSTSGACASGSVSCSTPGAVVCIGDSQFGICNTNNCALPQALAAGTNCTDGTIAKRDVTRRRSSRLHRHVPGHVHGHSF